MKKIKFFAVALAALAMFSCSKENGSEQEGPTGNKTMQITIAKGSVKPGGRAIQDPAGTYTTPINGNTIEVFFFASNDATSVLLARNTVTLTDAAGKYTGTATEVPNTSRYIYVVANTTPTATTVGSTTLAQLKAQVIDIAVGDLQDISKTPMTNATDVAQTFTDQDQPTMKVSLQISPVLARIEVASITGGGKITEFDFKGIFMNKYFPSFTLGAGGAGTFVGPVKDGTKLNAADVATWTYDFYETAQTGALTYNAGEGKVWGYMLAPATADNMPRIVLQLDNIKIGANDHNLNYITVKKFLKDGTEITTLERNTIYKISSITFDQDDTTIEPNQDNVSVEVGVEVSPWVPVDVTPEL